MKQCAVIVKGFDGTNWTNTYIEKTLFDCQKVCDVDADEITKIGLAVMRACKAELTGDTTDYDKMVEGILQTGG